MRRKQEFIARHRKEEVISCIKDVDWRVSIEVNMLPLSWTAYRREESKSLRCRHHTYSMCAVSERLSVLLSKFSFSNMMKRLEASFQTE